MVFVGSVTMVKGSHQRVRIDIRIDMIVDMELSENIKEVIEIKNFLIVLHWQNLKEVDLTNFRLII